MISTPRRRPPITLTAAGLLSTAALLAGCGSSGQAPQVASLAGSPSTSTSQSVLSTNGGVPDPDGRPRELLNDTDKQAGALYDPYYACLRAHRYVDETTAATRLTVAEKCEKLEPLPAWQVDPSNPQARAFVGRTVSCLQAKGYHARADLVTNVPITPPSWFVEYTPKTVGYEHQTELAQDTCQQQANR